MTHRVLKLHRRKMSLIYISSQEDRQCAFMAINNPPMVTHTLAQLRIKFVSTTLLWRKHKQSIGIILKPFLILLIRNRYRSSHESFWRGTSGITVNKEVC